MKILTIILWLLSVGNIISGIITLNNAPAEYKENATSSILMGIVFGVAAVACPYIKKMQDKKKVDKDNWEKGGN